MYYVTKAERDDDVYSRNSWEALYKGTGNIYLLNLLCLVNLCVSNIFIACIPVYSGYIIPINSRAVRDL